jgi:hypothetical protein
LMASSGFVRLIVAVFVCLDAGHAWASPTTPKLVDTRATTDTIAVTFSLHFNEVIDFVIVAYPEKGQPFVQERVDFVPALRVEHAIHGLRPGRSYVVSLKACETNYFLHIPFGPSDCSDWSAPREIRTPPVHPVAPAVTATPVGPRRVLLRWSIADEQRVSRIVVNRDGRPEAFLLGPPESLDGARAADVPSPQKYEEHHASLNTRHSYSLCFSNAAGTACSEPITAMGTPVTPSAPRALTVRRHQVPLGGTGGGITSASATIGGDSVTLTWEHAPPGPFIPGEFITIERQDRGVVDPNGQIGSIWREVARLSAAGNPTRESVPIARELGIRTGATYRVCATMPVMGPAGTACSQPASLP